MLLEFCGFNVYDETNTNDIDVYGGVGMNLTMKYTEFHQNHPLLVAVEN